MIPSIASEARPVRRIGTGLVVALVGVTLLAACSSSESDGEPEPSVVATTTMLGDVSAMVAQCAQSNAVTLMPIGVDPHDFAPSSEQVATMIAADLVVANGLGLEEGLQDALSAAETDGARVVEIAPLVDPIPFSEGESLDPHFWNDVTRMARGAELIGAELADVTGNEQYAQCGAEVSASLLQTDGLVRETLSQVAPDNRVMVTDHDAFGYFAQAYDFEIAGVVIPGGSTLAEPSSRAIADLVDVIESEGVEAIFSNTADPSAIVAAVAAEADTDIEVVELYVGSLGPDGSGAQTYAEMQQTNAQRIAGALAE